MNVQLTGWKAIATIVAVLGFGGFRYVTARQNLDTQGRQALEEWIALEFQRPLLADGSMSLEDKGQALLDVAEVDIVDLSARGSLERMVVRVEVAPNPAFPPGTELTRYYRMSYSRITGWVHRGPSSALSYHLALF